MPARRSALHMSGAVVIGVVVALAGTGVHRLNPPSGVVLALVTVACTAVLVRAWAGARGVLVLGATVVVMVVLLGRSGPGGDALITAQPVGYAWYLSPLVVAASGLLPRRWFSDRPVGEGHHVETRAP